MFAPELIKKYQSIPTPFYYYDLKVLDETLHRLKSAADKYGYVVHYAMKANANDKIIQLISDYGFGADCVSGNEIKKAMETGFPPNEIAFAGVGKSDEEIDIALQNDIFSLNVESVQEIEVINTMAGKLGKKAKIALRINPDVNAKTHHYITTGLEENKFGINRWELEKVLEQLEECKNVELTGLHFHIGSQITDMSPFRNLCNRVNKIQQWFFDRHIIVEHINVGGGLGVDYYNPDKNMIPDFNTFFKIFDDFLELRPKQQLHFELGRALVAHCGSLISKVLYIKEGINTNFAILDAGMTELIRPALYQSYHKIDNISRQSAVASRKYDVVGPICESSDCFGKAVDLPETKRGDLFVIRTTGAYGEVMVSQYNLRDKPKAVYSDEIGE
ncbi:MAG: diaminopimelate decarboxylase [Flavobacteriales bacterium]|nr:MAG: diaminopimelate decarboxylase [Flavobacteriales bacterium]